MDVFMFLRNLMYKEQKKEFFKLVKKLSTYNQPSADYVPQYLDVNVYSHQPYGPNGSVWYCFSYKRKTIFNGNKYMDFNMRYANQLPIYISELKYAIEEAEAIKEYFRKNTHINPIFTGLPYGAYDKNRRV